MFDTVEMSAVLLLWFLVGKGTLKPAVDPSNESCGSDCPRHRNAEHSALSLHLFLHHLLILAAQVLPGLCHQGLSPIFSLFQALRCGLGLAACAVLHQLWEAYLLKFDWVSSQVFLPRILSALCRLVFSVPDGFCIYYLQANFTFIGTSGMGVLFGSER